jgi:hypothetical protein
VKLPTWLKRAAAACGAGVAKWLFTDDGDGTKSRSNEPATDAQRQSQAANAEAYRATRRVDREH